MAPHIFVSQYIKEDHDRTKSWLSYRFRADTRTCYIWMVDNRWLCWTDHLPRKRTTIKEKLMDYMPWEFAVIGGGILTAIYILLATAEGRKAVRRKEKEETDDNK